MVQDLFHRKVSIILNTIDAINEFGLQGVSTREVAKRVGISEGAIFKHFKTKNDLMLAVLEYYSQYDSDIIASTMEKKQDSINALLFFINSFVEYYENYPAITAITQSYDVLTCDDCLREKIKAISEKRRTVVKELLENGQKFSQIKTDVDVEKLTDAIAGSIQYICLKWRMSQYSFSLKEYSISTIEMLLKAFIIK